MNSSTKDKWSDVRDLMDDRRIKLGRPVSDWFNHQPRKVLNVLSYYKFAAKMVGPDKKVLDVECSQGLGTWLLAKECGCATGIDSDENVIARAQSNWTQNNINFYCENILRFDTKKFNAVVLFEQAHKPTQSTRECVIKKISDILCFDGIALIGSVPKKLKDDSEEHLEIEMLKYFKHVFTFSAIEEIIQPGFSESSNFTIALGCRKYE